MMKRRNLQHRINQMKSKGIKIEEILKKLAKEGYVFHGSSKKIDVLIPKKSDYRGIKLPIKRVSASPYPEYAEFFALISKRGRGIASVNYKNGKLIFEVEEGRLKAMRPGYVHIVKGQKLGGPFKKYKFRKEAKMEVRSKKLVPVEAVIEIKPSDFKYKIGLIKKK